MESLLELIVGADQAPANLSLSGNSPWGQTGNITAPPGLGVGGDGGFSMNLGILDKACFILGHRNFEIRGFDNSAGMDTYMKDGGESSNVFYGIDFKNEEWTTGSTIPKTLGIFF